MKRALLLCCALALAGALVLWLAAPLPDIEVRSLPRQLHAGRLIEGQSLGQGFECRADGLRRIDVALVPMGRLGPGELLLTLRRRAPDAEVLREARVAEAALDSAGGFLSFEFEPVPDSAGSSFFFELSPPEGARISATSPHLRYRGAIDAGLSWGGRVVEGDRFEREYRCERDLLSGFALALKRLDGPPPRLELFDAAGGEPLRSCVPSALEHRRGGYCLFPFEPLVESRGRALRWRLTAPAGTQLIANGGGPAQVPLFGRPGFLPRLLGATEDGQRLLDRDLVFRAWADAGPGLRLALLRERAGWRLPAGLLAALAAFAALARLRLRPADD